VRGVGAGKAGSAALVVPHGHRMAMGGAGSKRHAKQAVASSSSSSSSSKQQAASSSSRSVLGPGSKSGLLQPPCHVCPARRTRTQHC